MSADGEENPTKTTWKPYVPRGGEWHEPFLAALRACGVVLIACQAAKVHRSTAYEHRKHDDEFRRQWDEAVEESLDRVEFEAFKLAMGTKPTEVDPGNPPSERMIIFLLQSRRREVYGSVQRFEHTGADGGSIKTEFTDADRLAAHQRLSLIHI